MEFRSPNMPKRKHSKPEVCNGLKLVETAGYITKKKRIEMLINAGKRLEILRQSYDMYDEIDENFPTDPTRKGDFDLSDYSYINNNLMKKRKRIAQSDLEVLDKKVAEEVKNDDSNDLSTDVNNSVDK